jgi:hypothetical protein
MSESTLRDFPPIPSHNSITVAEFGSQLITIPSNPDDPVDGDRFCDKIASYRKINAKNLEPTFQHKIPLVRTARDNRDTFIVSKDEGVIKGMWDACRDSGFQGLERYLRQVEKNPVINVLYGCLSALSSISHAAFKLKHEAMVIAFPHLGVRSYAVVNSIN